MIQWWTDLKDLCYLYQMFICSIELRTDPSYGLVSIVTCLLGKWEGK